MRLVAETAETKRRTLDSILGCLRVYYEGLVEEEKKKRRKKKGRGGEIRREMVVIQIVRSSRLDYFVVEAWGSDRRRDLGSASINSQQFPGMLSRLLASTARECVNSGRIDFG